MCDGQKSKMDLKMQFKWFSKYGRKKAQVKKLALYVP